MVTPDVLMYALAPVAVMFPPVMFPLAVMPPPTINLFVDVVAVVSMVTIPEVFTVIPLLLAPSAHPEFPYIPIPPAAD